MYHIMQENVFENLISFYLIWIKFHFIFKHESFTITLTDLMVFLNEILLSAIKFLERNGLKAIQPCDRSQSTKHNVFTLTM